MKRSKKDNRFLGFRLELDLNADAVKVARKVVIVVAAAATGAGLLEIVELLQKM